MKKVNAKIEKFDVTMYVIERGDNAAETELKLKKLYKNVNAVSVGEYADYEDWREFKFALPPNAAALEAAGLKSDNLFYFECF